MAPPRKVVYCPSCLKLYRNSPEKVQEVARYPNGRLAKTCGSAVCQAKAVQEATR